MEFDHFCKGEFHRNDLGCVLTSLNHKKPTKPRKTAENPLKISKNHSKSLKTAKNRRKTSEKPNSVYHHKVTCLTFL